MSASEELEPRLMSRNRSTAVDTKNGRIARRRAKERTSRNRAWSPWLDSLQLYFFGGWIAEGGRQRDAKEVSSVVASCGH